jgi:hypothetical protein
VKLSILTSCVILAAALSCTPTAVSPSPDASDASTAPPPGPPKPPPVLDDAAVVYAPDAPTGPAADLCANLRRLGCVEGKFDNCESTFTHTLATKFEPLGPPGEAPLHCASTAADVASLRACSTAWKGACK